MLSESLVLSFCGSYLGCLCTSSGGSSPLILESPTTPSGVTAIIIHSFLYLFISSFLAPFPFLLYSCVLIFLFGFSILLLSIICFNFEPHHHQHHIISFSLCSLVVNLHTYLTTWLSSCSVGIFFGSLTIFCLKQKLINKVQRIKMCNPKIYSQQSLLSL